MGKKYKKGDIVAIPLPVGGYAFGKLYGDASIGVFDLLSDEVLPPEEVLDHPFSFFSGIFDTAITNGSWPRIGHAPFPDQESSWPPPQYIQDVIDPSKFRIYHKGEMRPATRQEAECLDKALMRKPEHLVDEICRRVHKRKVR